MITALYQPIGSSSHQLAAKLGRQINQPTTHTGTLDPMADGVLICLSGNERLQKSQFSNWQKEYLFSILIGFSTDSHDLLGLITATESISPSQQQKIIHTVQKKISHLIGSYSQAVPHFSAKRINGQSFFDLARNKTNIPPAFQDITISSLNLVEQTTITNEHLNHYLDTTINLVKGDFRQQNCLNLWKKNLLSQTDNSSQHLLLTFTMTCSKRTYVRGLVRDLSALTKIPMTTFHISRTKNGPYQIADCICLL